MRVERAACVVWAVACFALAACAQDEEAPGAAILETRMTLALDKARVRKVVEAIAKETGMQYMAVDEALDMETTVSLHVRDVPVEAILEFLEEYLKLDVPMGHLEETGILMLAMAEDEEEDGDEEEREEFTPQLDHAEALEKIRSHPTVARLLKKMPDLAIELEWDADDRQWEAEIRLGDEEVGQVRLREFEEGEPRIVKLEIDRELLGPAPAPQRRENF
jgi:hypothetical protein